MLQNIRIVLVETSHSGNIGSASRAMKTMGLSNLYLVSPKSVDEQSIALAAGADDVVRNANIVDTFEQAIENCSLVIGTSARLRIKAKWQSCSVVSVLGSQMKNYLNVIII